jgi:hypothetical protein
LKEFAMPNVVSRAGLDSTSLRRPLAEGLKRGWSATLAAYEVFAEALAEARAMQRAAWRRYPFIDS